MGSQHYRKLATLLLVALINAVPAGALAEESTATDLVTLQPRVNWTVDGEVLVTATILPTPFAGRVPHARLTVTRAEGAALQPFPSAAGLNAKRQLTAAESSLTAGSLDQPLSTFTGTQLTGLFRVPQDRPSTITFTVTAETAQGPVTVTQPVTIDPYAIRGSVLVITPPPPGANPAFPARSSVAWTSDEAPQ